MPPPSTPSSQATAFAAYAVQATAVFRLAPICRDASRAGREGLTTSSQPATGVRSSRICTQPDLVHSHNVPCCCMLCRNKRSLSTRCFPQYHRLRRSHGAVPPPVLVAIDIQQTKAKQSGPLPLRRSFPALSAYVRLQKLRRPPSAEGRYRVQPACITRTCISKQYPDDRP